ncbi:MAG: alpha-L-rhamnosidase N-terminal domain-containing protein, partial [Cyclobacteriaceae bacterium]|nr:alpha-L-rhamnosidase N-terminal domain-containing protein [Cyclobacteriaceae bacterium]
MMKPKIKLINGEMSMKLTILVCTLINICCTTFAKEMKIRQGVTGIWFQPNEHEDSSFIWQSQWIWLDENIESDVMLARRFFELTEAPKEAILRITASSKYQLYVNGEYVCRGPARSAPHHQSYDILNISGLLHAGKNTLAVRIHHQKGKYSYHHKGRAGLLAQLDFISDKKEFTVITDSNWKVAPDPSWDNEAPKINRFQQIVSDRVDMRKYLKGWSDNVFDDANWSNAKPLMRNIGWPSPQNNSLAQALTPPWTSLV